MIARAAPRRLGVDPWLAGAAIALITLGGLVVQAVSSGDAGDPALIPPTAESARRGFHVLLGVVAMLIASRVDYRVLRPLAVPIYLAALAALAGVLVVGTSEFGAKRWVDLGVMTVQPSEFAKVALAIALAALAAAREPGARAVAGSVLLLAPVVGLVLIEPDLGTSLVAIAAWFVLLVAWGTPWRVLGAMLLAGIAALPLAFAVAVPDYQRERIAIFLDPGHDPLGSGFSIRQVEIALGSGGVLGRGLFSSAPSALDGLSTRTSDFIFAELGGSLGVLGGVAVIALLGVLTWRGAAAALRAPDAFGRILATAITAMIVLQAMLHVGVNVRLVPPTGIALPLVSQGGSAILAVGIGLGILHSIAAHRPATPREQWSGSRWR